MTTSAPRPPGVPQVPDGMVVVGRVGRAHGVRGDVAVEVRTDDPDLRFAAGAELGTLPERGPLVVEQARWHSGRLLVRFAGVADRSAAESLRGVLLVLDRVAAVAAATLADDEWWDHEIAGLRAEDPSGAVLGSVGEVVHLPGQDLLSVRRPDGGEVLVPFVRAFVPVVDVPGGRVVVDPPAGLLEEPPDPGAPGG